MATDIALAGELPQALCGCGHIEGVHLVTDTGRGACGATVHHGARSPRCPCKRFAPGGRALATPAPPEPPWRVEQCRSCFQPIIWCDTPNARDMPVDAEPALQGGNVALDWRGDHVKPLARVLGVAAQFGRRNLHTNHLATCPDKGRWRRRTRGGQ